MTMARIKKEPVRFFRDFKEQLYHLDFFKDLAKRKARTVFSHNREARKHWLTYGLRKGRNRCNRFTRSKNDVL